MIISSVYSSSLYSILIKAQYDGNAICPTSNDGVRLVPVPHTVSCVCPNIPERGHDCNYVPKTSNPPSILRGIPTNPGVQPNQKNDNAPPIANAGKDQVISSIRDPIYLDGTASRDPDNDPISYSWQQVDGPSINLDNPSSAMPHFTILENIPHDSVFRFKLTVTDNQGHTSSPSTVTIQLGCYVDIWVSAFLPPWTPNGRVPNPAPIHNSLIDPETHRPLPRQIQHFDYHQFSTDQRNTPQKGGSARQWSYVVVDMCSSNAPLVKKLHGIGLSHGYRYEWQAPNFDKLVEVEDCARSDANAMNEEITQTGSGVKVHVVGSTPIPFVRIGSVNVAPNIDYDFTIYLMVPQDKIVTPGTLAYKVTGQHDGFPAYEIFIGFHSIYFHTPKVIEGQNPLNPFGPGHTLARLFPGMGFQVNIPQEGFFNGPNMFNLPMSEAYEKNFATPQPTQTAEPIHPCGILPGISGNNQGIKALHGPNNAFDNGGINNINPLFNGGNISGQKKSQQSLLSFGGIGNNGFFNNNGSSNGNQQQSQQPLRNGNYNDGSSQLGNKGSNQGGFANQVGLFSGGSGSQYNGFSNGSINGGQSPLTGGSIKNNGNFENGDSIGVGSSYGNQLPPVTQGSTVNYLTYDIPELKIRIQAPADWQIPISCKSAYNNGIINIQSSCNPAWTAENGNVFLKIKDQSLAAKLGVNLDKFFKNMKKAANLLHYKIDGSSKFTLDEGYPVHTLTYERKNLIDGSIILEDDILVGTQKKMPWFIVTVTSSNQLDYLKTVVKTMKMISSIIPLEEHNNDAHP